jgi:co-chaperonin GroES (HSP10)
MFKITLENFRPLNGWMVVKMDPEEWTTEHGLIVRPQGSREHLWRKGTVLKVSDGWARLQQKDKSFKYRRVPATLEPGMRILFPFYLGEKMFPTIKQMLADDNMVLLKPEDVILYDDPNIEGLGIDEVDLSEGNPNLEPEE